MRIIDMNLIKHLVRKKRIVFFIISLALITAMQWLALSFKILDVEPDVYHERAVDLKVTSEYRYGYSWSWHGAILVKTCNIQGSEPQALKGLPFDEGDLDEPPDEYASEDDPMVGSSHKNGSPSVPDDSVEEIMRKELTLVPWKFMLELILYVVMLSYAFFGIQWVMNKFRIDQWRDIGQYLFMATAWIVFWIIVFLPLGLLGYGNPIHSTWEGPGAFSYSYIPPRISTGSGLTVSYRYVIDILSSYPMMLFMMLFSVIAQGFKYLSFDGGKIHVGLALMGTMFYGLGGIVYHLRKRKAIFWRIMVRVFLIIAGILFIIISPFPPWRQPEWVRELMRLLFSIYVKSVLPWL